MGKCDATHQRYHDLERALTLRLCEDVGSARALTVSLLLENNEDEQLVNLEIDPSHYTEARHFAGDYQVTKALSKCTYGLKLDTDRTAVAEAGFLQAEQRCRETNGRMNNGTVSPVLLREAGKVIRRVLPPLFASDGKLSRAGRRILDEISAEMRLGPGSVTSLSDIPGLVQSDKYDAETHLTLGLYPYARAIMGDYWSNSVARKVIVPGNRFTTVPKNAKTERGICIEPDLNVYGQLGIGKVLKRLLKRVLGIDLNSQEWNRFLAEMAFTWRLATLDLSQASDLTARRLVEELFPSDWVYLFDLFRSPKTLFRGNWVELEKWSSMGNGYTFELETLIFASVVLAVLELREAATDWAHCAIFGDDIIVPSRHAVAVVEALEDFGFKVNGSKTHLAGAFYESCGTDWFAGKPVQPFYIRRKQEDEGIPYPLQLANRLRVHCKVTCDLPGYADDTHRKTWEWLKSRIPSAWNHIVPESLGDVGLIGDLTEATGVSPAWWHPKHGYTWLEGWFVPSMQLQPLKIRKRSTGRLLLALTRAGDAEPILTRGWEPRKGLFGLPVAKKVHVSTWTESFTWMKIS